MTTNMDTKLAMKTEKKPFCKICFDTKQPESVYTSHYVRDVPGPNGVVVCPTLLQIECRYCKKKGHTNSKCPILMKKQNRISNKPFSTATTSTAPSLGKKKHKNVFQVLEVDSGDDEEDKLDNEPTTTHTNSTDSTAKPYIMALKKPIAATPEPTKVQYKPETPPGPPPGYYASKSWADYSDSDDDDDE